MQIADALEAGDRTSLEGRRERAQVPRRRSGREPPEQSRRLRARRADLHAVQRNLLAVLGVVHVARVGVLGTLTGHAPSLRRVPSQKSSLRLLLGIAAVSLGVVVAVVVVVVAIVVVRIIIIFIL